MHLRLPLILVCSLIWSSVAGQVIYEVHSKWDDSIEEWEIITDMEDDTNYFETIWNGEQHEWEYTIGEISGQAKLKWEDDPNLWEFSGYDQTVTARTVWPDDFSRWRISDGENQIVLQMKFKNSINEWVISNEDHGHFLIYVEYENDFRDWVVEDELNEEIGTTMRFALVFLSVFHSSPVY